jgi:hypothetical protein
MKKYQLFLLSATEFDNINKIYCLAIFSEYVLREYGFSTGKIAKYHGNREKKWGFVCNLHQHGGVNK